MAGLSVGRGESRFLLWDMAQEAAGRLGGGGHSERDASPWRQEACVHTGDGAAAMGRSWHAGEGRVRPPLVDG